MNTSSWAYGHTLGDNEAILSAEFYPGDVVALHAQPQLMTVEDVCDCGTVHVVWFAGNDDVGYTLHRDSFDSDMLVNLDADDE